MIIGNTRHHVPAGTLGTITDLYEKGYGVKVIGDYTNAANKKIENRTRILWFPPEEIVGRAAPKT